LCLALLNVPPSYMETYGPGGQACRFPALIEAFKLVKKGNGPGIVVPCNSAAFVDFHDLVTATIIGYYRTIRILKKAKNLKAPDVAIAWNYFHIFWRIAYSPFFRVYLSALDQAQLLHVPIKSRLEGYTKTINSALKPEDLFPEETWFEDENEESEGLVVTDSDNGLKTYLKYQRWARLQVTHLEALSILSSLPKRPETFNINLKLIVVNQPRKAATEPWEDTIMRLQDPIPGIERRRFPHNLDLQHVKDTLRNYLQHPGGKFGDERAWISSFNRWNTSYSGSVHCESALAALAAYPDAAIHEDYERGDELKDLIHVCDCFIYLNQFN
jgi:hypothetical protein